VQSDRPELSSQFKSISSLIYATWKIRSPKEITSLAQDLFNILNEEFYFELDVCAIAENSKCKNTIVQKMMA